MEAVPAWYEQGYEARIWGPKKEMMRTNEATLNHGRTWRLGLAADVFGPSPKFRYYPEFSKQMAQPAKSKRAKAEQDAVKPGEQYKSSVDHSAPTLTQAIEEPGVFSLASQRSTTYRSSRGLGAASLVMCGAP